MKKLTIFLVGLMTACSGLNLFNGAKDQPLITVGEDKIFADEFIYAFSKNRSADSITTKEDIDDYLQLYVNFKLKVAEAKSRGMDTTKAFKTEYNSYISQLDNSYLKAGNDTDSLVKQAFARLQFEIRASHILITVNENDLPEDTLKAYQTALALRDSLANGSSFGRIAATYSQDPSARQNKGDLGYFTVFQMVYPFESAAYGTAVGDVSMPVRTKFGYHLIKVTDKRANEGKVRVAHIMIRSSNTARDKIIEVYEQLMAGADWQQTCQQNSEDAQTAGKGGVLAPFNRNQIVAEFAEAAFNLTEPNELSDPVQTKFGWHIIKLIERLPVDDFEANEKQLRSQVRRDSRSQISKQKMLDRLAKENNLQEDKVNVKLILAPENHLFVKNKWVFEKDTLANQTLFTINDSTFQANQFYDLISESTRQQNTQDFLTEMYNTFKERSIIAYEKDHLADKYDDYKYLKEEYHDGILLFSIMEEEVWAKAGEDSTGLAKYYEEHKADFIDSTKIGVIIFSSSIRSPIDSVAKLYPTPSAYNALLYSEKQTILSGNNEDSQLSLQVESGELSLHEHAVLKNISLPYESSPFELDNRWYYILVLRSPEEPMPLAEVRGKIIADYQEVLEERWLKELNRKYLVEVNQSTLKKVYKKFEII